MCRREGVLCLLAGEEGGGEGMGRGWGGEEMEADEAKTRDVLRVVYCTDVTGQRLFALPVAPPPPRPFFLPCERSGRKGNDRAYRISTW